MRYKYALLLALLMTGKAHAQLNFLSSSQSVSASANVSIHQYASSNFTYTANSGSVGGSIFLTDPNPDKFGNSNESAYFVSDANLGAAYGAKGISINSSVSAQGKGPSDESGGGGSGSASSAFQVTFGVSSPQMFSMSAMHNWNGVEPGEMWLSFSLILTSSNQGFICGLGNQGEGTPGDEAFFSGLLVPGDVYTLQDTMEVYGGIDDPFGESLGLQGSASLNVVPEPSSNLLLGMGAVGLLAMLKHRNTTSVQ